MHSVGGEPGRVTALATILHWPTDAAAAAAVDEDDEEEELVADRPMALSRAQARSNVLFMSHRPARAVPARAVADPSRRT